jgi:hypothetical protein
MGDKKVNSLGHKSTNKTPKPRLRTWCGHGKCDLNCDEGFIQSKDKSLKKTKNFREKHKITKELLLKEI